MIVGELRISASTDHDGDIIFDILISRGTLQVQVDIYFWGDANCFEEFGEKLMTFPKSLEDIVELEIGQIRLGSHQSYLLLKAYCYDASGHSVLKIVTHNNEPEPETQRIEFSIPAEAVALNNLGKLLKNWQPSTTPEIKWQTQVS